MAENKRFYWLKLKRDFFKRHDIQVIENMPNGKDYVLFYLKLLLESIDHEGQLRFSETIPYDENMLSAVTSTNIDIVRTSLKIFSELQMIELWEDRTLYMREVQKMLGSETTWAAKKREYRESVKALPKDNPRTSEDNVRQEIEKETETEFKRKSNNTKTASPFDEILSEIENEELRQTYRDYIEMRKAIKAPMTARALRLLINRVNSLETSVDGKCALLETAILNNWKSVYAPKEAQGGKNTPKNSINNKRKSTGASGVENAFWDDLQAMYEEE